MRWGADCFVWGAGSRVGTRRGCEDPEGPLKTPPRRGQAAELCGSPGPSPHAGPRPGATLGQRCKKHVSELPLEKPEDVG